MRRPKRPCGKVGCPQLVQPPERYCAEHQREDDAQRREREREYDSRRGSAHQRGYGATWRRLRRAYLQRNPLCVMCLEEGRVVPAREVDHIIPKRQGGTDDWENLRPLCRHHHAQRHAKEGHRWGRNKGPAL